jgi:hypothetical protein
MSVVVVLDDPSGHVDGSGTGVDEFDPVTRRATAGLDLIDLHGGRSQVVRPRGRHRDEKGIAVRNAIADVIGAIKRDVEDVTPRAHLDLDAGQFGSVQGHGCAVGCAQEI